MAKLDETKVVGEFYGRLNQFLDSGNVKSWRSEVKNLFNAMANEQWNGDDVEKRGNQNKPITTANRMAPVIKAIAGHNILNRSELQVIPRKDASTPEEDIESDVMSDAIEYLQDESEFHFESASATEDMLICGIGGTQTYFDYTNPSKPYGEMMVDRIFPGYLLFDNTCSKRNFKIAMWAGHVEIVNKEWLDEEIRHIRGDDYRPDDFSTRTTRGINDFLFFADTVTTDNVDVLYHYEWFDYQRTVSFKNILLQHTDKNVLMDMAAEFEEDTDVDLSAPYVTMSRGDYRKFRAMLLNYHEQGNVDLREFIETTNGQRRVYYKARIARDTILDASENWAGDFTIQYKTGYYDEMGRQFYGLGRSMLPIQRQLNIAVSDYESYLDSVPKGGLFMEEDATHDPVAFKETRANEQALTMLKSGGLMKMREKPIPAAPTGLTDYIGLQMQLITSVIGLPADFLGMVESGNMTNSLYGKIVKQAYMVLAHFFESDKVYNIRQGGIFVDAARIISENYDGLVLDKVTGSGKYGEEFALSKDVTHRDYNLKVISRPLSEDEKLEQFQQVAEMSQTLLNKQNPVDITPLLVEMWPYDLENKEEIVAKMDEQRQMQQQQMQMQQEQMQAQAEASKPSQMEIDLIEAETRKKIAEAQLDEAKALAEIASIKGRSVTRKDTIENGVLSKQEITTETTTN